MRSRRETTRRAFTLIETIATIVVLAVLGSSASMILLTSTDGYIDAASQGQLSAEASVSLDRIVRELRSIPLDSPAGGLAPDIDTVTVNSITWKDGDGDACSLTLSGTDLMLAVDGQAAAVLQGDVATLSVATFDESNAALAGSLSGATCDAIRRIELTMTLQRSGVAETLRTRLFLRCTMVGAEVGP